MTENPDLPYDKYDANSAHQEQIIRDLAYKIWESEGCQEGMSDFYWRRAVERLEDERQSAYPSAQSRGDRD